MMSLIPTLGALGLRSGLSNGNNGECPTDKLLFVTDGHDSAQLIKPQDRSTTAARALVVKAIIDLRCVFIVTCRYVDQ